MKLSKRLQAIAEMINTDRVIDIGCDHALLDIYLAKEKNISCIATDIRPNIIEIAKKNLRNSNLQDKIKFIVTDGIINVPIKKEDTIVISGMGTSTILHILKNFNYKNPIIISSHNELSKLRKEMHRKKYKIKQEKVVFEKNKCYVIIQFIKGYQKYSWSDYILGPYAKKNIEYLQYLYNKYHSILKQMPNKYWQKKIKIWKIKHKIKKLINSF